MTLPKGFSNIPKLPFPKFKDEKKHFVFIGGNEKTTLNRPSDLLLSPAFYWVAKERLPVTKLREAKKLFPSVTEGLLPEGRYRFIGMQDPEDPHFYTIIAYDEKKIAEKLKELGIQKENVKRIYFIQSFARCIEKPIAVDEKNAIDQANGIVFSTPRHLVEQIDTFETFLECAENLDVKPVHISLDVLDRRFLSIDSGQALKISATITFLAILFMAEGGYYWWTDRQLLRQNAEIAEKYRIPATGYQRKAVMRKLLDRRDRVVNQRHTFETLFHLPLKPHETVERLNYLKHELALAIRVASKERAQKLLDSLASKMTILRSTFDKGLLTIEAKQ